MFHPSLPSSSKQPSTRWTNIFLTKNRNILRFFSSPETRKKHKKTKIRSQKEGNALKSATYTYYIRRKFLSNDGLPRRRREYTECNTGGKREREREKENFSSGGGPKLSHVFCYLPKITGLQETQRRWEQSTTTIPSPTFPLPVSLLEAVIAAAVPLSPFQRSLRNTRPPSTMHAER